MRYMLTGDLWSAEEAYRRGEVQEVAPHAKEALDAGIQIANKIADCGPLGIQTSLASAHLAIDHTEEEALSKLDGQFGALFHTQDFQEGRMRRRKTERRSTRENKRRSKIGYQDFRDEVDFLEWFVLPALDFHTNQEHGEIPQMATEALTTIMPGSTGAISGGHPINLPRSASI